MVKSLVKLLLIIKELRAKILYSVRKSLLLFRQERIQAKFNSILLSLTVNNEK